MRWTKLKSSLEALRAPTLRGRVALHQARYRYTREEVGRIWVTVDGREVASFDTSTYIRRRAELGADLFEIRRAETPGRAPDHAAHLETDDRARDILRRAGQYRRLRGDRRPRGVPLTPDRRCAGVPESPGESPRRHRPPGGQTAASHATSGSTRARARPTAVPAPLRGRGCRHPAACRLEIAMKAVSALSTARSRALVLVRSRPVAGVRRTSSHSTRSCRGAFRRVLIGEASGPRPSCNMPGRKKTSQ